ncbi:hypothetical protein GCM10010272_01140 [Streptomyces lateritius]|nr:hypothetical protein GCM10010272_01140 [Streptomyces lateritius]
MRAAEESASSGQPKAMAPIREMRTRAATARGPSRMGRAEAREEVLGEEFGEVLGEGVTGPP